MQTRNMKRNKTNLNFKNISLFFFYPNCSVLTLISAHRTAPGHSSAIAISGAHQQPSAKLRLKQIGACLDTRSFSGEAGTGFGATYLSIEDILPLKPCPLQGEGWNPPP